MRKISIKGFKVTKAGKVEKVHRARDASHAIAMKKSKKQKVVRRTKVQ